MVKLKNRKRGTREIWQTGWELGEKSRNGDISPETGEMWQQCQTPTLGGDKQGEGGQGGRSRPPNQGVWRAEATQGSSDFLHCEGKIVLIKMVYLLPD